VKRRRHRTSDDDGSAGLRAGFADSRGDPADARQKGRRVVQDASGGFVAPASAGPISARRWLARLTFLLATAAVALLVIFGERHSLAILAIALASAALSLAAGYLFLACRGLRRWLALAVLVLSPVGAIVVFALAGLLWVAAASAAAWLLAGVTARAALAPDPADWRMPEYQPSAPARRPFLIMNPRSGGGKVEKFGLREKAESRGAQVFLMSDPGPVDVSEVARHAAADGADLLGAAGGDGTQALVATVAAEHGIPFMVITAGTRNHFALDLGLDRDNPAACLDALDDGVDLYVDLGTAGARTFVNNVSFGAYAEVVQSPAYRDDKAGTTLNVLPDLISGERGARLTVRAGDARLDGPQAVLVANNPYGTSDLAGLSRRPRLDRGLLGVVGISVRSARQAAGLLRGRHSSGVSRYQTTDVIVDADAEQIPVGIDGEAVMMPTPVRCTIRPAALRVRVPRNRPGVPVPAAELDWVRLRQLAAPGRWSAA
jgi:diacylglycerol kinase family enzyme